MNYFEPIPNDGFPDTTFGRVFHIFGKRWKEFLWISFLVYIIGWAFAVFTSLVLGGTILVDGYSVRMRLHYADSNPWHIVSFVVESIIYYGFACVANAAIAWLVACLYLERSPRIRDAFLRAVRRLGALLSTLLLATIVTLTPCLFLLWLQLHVVNSDIFFLIVQITTWLYMLYITIILYHLYPIIVVERENGHCINPWKILDRSFLLSQKRLLYILAVLFFWFLAKLFLAIPISLLRQMNTYNDGSQKTNTPIFYIASSLDTILGIFFMTMDSVFQGVLYLQNRITKEKLDNIALSEELGVDCAIDEEDNDYVVMSKEDASENDASSGALTRPM
eukprot:CAMPEP_0178927438 /NCGR_PEP_ID=MMETSP0786-20121207/19192_1 /TAXON_ID=186022 /ORGANISM="Thalassionema frauenfeldii, Strain CCMP 1798" /LENGTH=334 /DNA_ID=CAMNT_0020602879 /DNA_START=86 /DNA_END=1090 /DNA_ORIENTATION=-